MLLYYYVYRGTETDRSVFIVGRIHLIFEYYPNEDIRGQQNNYINFIQ